MKSMAILEINAILNFTHNKFGQQTDLSKINRKKKENSGEKKIKKSRKSIAG